MTNISDKLSPFKVAFGGDYRKLRFTNHETVESAFADYQKNHGTFILELSQISGIPDKPITKYRILAQKPSPEFNSVSVQLTSNPSLEELKGVVLS